MPFNNFKYNIKGFSLLELLVSIGLIALVTAIALPNLRNFTNNQELDATASQLVNILKNAQSSASSHVICPNGKTALSWQVDLNIAGAVDTYSMVSNCTATPLPNKMTVYTSPFAPTPTNPVTFNAEIDVCQGGNTAIVFTNSQIAYLCASTGIPSTGTVRITLRKSGVNPKVVVVEPGGVIRIE